MNSLRLILLQADTIIFKNYTITIGSTYGSTIITKLNKKIKTNIGCISIEPMEEIGFTHFAMVYPKTSVNDVTNLILPTSCAMLNMDQKQYATESIETLLKAVISKLIGF